MTIEAVSEPPAAETAAQASLRRGAGPWRRELAAFLQLFAAAGVTLAQPALDLLGKNTGIFVSARATRSDVLVVTALVLLGPALVGWALELAVGLVSASARRQLHAVLIGAFVAVFASATTKQATEWPAGAFASVGVAAGAGVALLVLRARWFGQFLRVLAVAPPVFAVLFLAFSPVSSIVVGSATERAAGARIGAPSRVVMIIMDELPLTSLLDGNGRIDAELFPSFAKLAATSTWFRNTTAVAPFTEQSVPAILTGQNPSNPDAKPWAADYPDTVFRLLGGTYRMNVHEPVTALCPEAICASAGAGSSTQARLAGIGRSIAEMWGDYAGLGRPAPPSFNDLESVPAQLGAPRRFLATLEPSEKPTFDYLHVLLPHQPWRYLPTLQETRFSEDSPWAVSNLLAWQTQAAADVGKVRHLLQLQAADVFLGRIIDRLEHIGAWDDSLVLVTADHGVAFLEQQPLRGVTEANAKDLLWVPLFVKAPGEVDGRIDDRPADLVDVLPTVADQLDTAIPWSTDGVSLLGAPRPEFPRRVYQWSIDRLQPPGIPLAAGGEYLTFPAEEYFPALLSARAAPAGGPPAWRPYRVGPYASLIGTSVDDRVDPGAPGPRGLAVDDLSLFETVEPKAKAAPWTWLEGLVVKAQGPQALAFVVNGRVAGLAWVDPIEGSTAGYYATQLIPDFFVAGRNDLRAYAVSGPANAPLLKPLEMYG